ncbi:hypothetical protein [Nonomuraea sp. JJY05]|uniref:hypothetical protein n=1 Tax=Nonomuraea sp. JJY05 TaxID=3350255 RepID=UPI00373EF83E
MTHPFPFHPAFAVTARTGLTATASRSWAAELTRGPRLLVPVDVQALVVEPGSAEARGGVASRLLDALVQDPAAPGPRSEAPFTVAPPLPAGVHLHWALPDGLTASHIDGPGVAPVWPALPDRWVVVRLGPYSGKPRPVRAWMLEAEKGGSADLDGWRPGGASAYRTPLLRPEQLTAVCGGDPAWAAVYDNVVDRFAFHDDLSSPPPGSRLLAYAVIGWYSQPELDPLAHAGGPAELEAILRRHGWHADLDRLARVQAERERATAQAAALGRTSRVIPRAAAVGAFGLPADRRITDTRPWWPRQCTFHGVIYGVGRQVDPSPDPRPDPAVPRVAIGSTSEEALAALVCGELGTPEAELLYQAFGYGLAETLGDPDGLARLEEELHTRGFVARPGSSHQERIVVGDPFTGVRPATPPTPALDEVRRGAADREVGFEFTTGRAGLTDLHTLRTQRERVDPPADPRRTDTVRRAAPRLFHPQDPVILVRGLRRSLRHGYDGRHSPGETLACRVSGDTITRFAGVIDGREMLSRLLGHGALPPEADDLVVEASVEDPFADHRETFQRLSSYGLSPAMLFQRMQAESALLIWSLAFPSRAASLSGLSLKDGVGSSPVGITIWRQPWIPLWCEWELDLDAHPTIAAWQLDEVDFRPEAGAGFEASRAESLRGRTSLRSAPARGLGDAISRFLQEEDRLDLRGTGRISADLQARLLGLGSAAGLPDLLAAGFDGLRERLLGFDDQAATAPGSPLPPHTPPRPLRAGFAQLRQLRVVDAFGRVLDLLDGTAAPPRIGAGLREPGIDGLVVRPRLTRPATLSFRLVDAADDSRPASVDQADGGATPLAGWLLADHADGAVELFAPGGAPVGQLRHDGLTGAVVWEGPPGDRLPVGAPPSAALGGTPALRHLLGLADALIERDLRERAAGQKPSDTPLDALLRIIDTTAVTVGHGGQTGNEHLSQLVGQPIAVVRARLSLEMEPEPAFPTLPALDQAERAAVWTRLAGLSFPVRLGALTRLDDGLLAFFADDDYGLIRPVHPAVLTQATPSARHRGDFAAPAGRVTTPRPLVTPSASGDPVLLLRPGQAVSLTLLMDPAAKAHATCGLLPRKSVSLLRDWVADDLAVLVPSLRVGPVLVDPATIRLPLTAAPAGGRTWTRREGPAQWRDDPIVAATQQALLPDLPVLAQEGYIRIRLEEREDG